MEKFKSGKTLEKVEKQLHFSIYNSSPLRNFE